MCNGVMHSHKLFTLHKSVYEVICVLPNTFYSQSVCFFQQTILCSNSSFSDIVTKFHSRQICHVDLQTLSYVICRNIYNLSLYSSLQSSLRFLKHLLSKWWSCLGFSHHVVKFHSNISQYIPLKHQNRPLLYDVMPPSKKKKTITST